ncbi:MAG: hypothetical protein LBQ84_08545 [Flavobacteriaceae bacterium]|jgi:hypothetical protein|nr:hypothetical protein [Flavobacteriaceae bacterium]
MKKFFSLVILVLSFGLVFTHCSSDDDNDYYREDRDTVAEIYEFPNQIFLYDPALDEFYLRYDFQLFSGENLLIYIKSGEDNGAVWKLLPNYANYIENNTAYPMNYNYDFTDYDFEITAWGNSTPPNLVATFRVVVIPGYFAQYKGAAPPVDYNDYHAVIDYFKIDESKIKVLKP